jgi:transposase-like protein
MNLKKIDGIKCPICRKENIVYNGWKKNLQLYYCKNCKKKFSKPILRNKDYDLSIYINALSYYNLGNTLDKVVYLINQKYGINLSKDLVYSWIKGFSRFCNCNKIRSYILKENNGRIISSYSYTYNNLTRNFMVHKPKIKILCEKYPTLSKYILNIKEIFPSDFFNKNKKNLDFKLDIDFRKEGRYNQSCRLADIALSACNKDDERHNFVENFMLINDSSTIACNIPIWFWEKYFDEGICGHIDLVKIRRGKIYIMDFKPDNSKEKDKKTASNLFLYASGLSFRTSIPLMRFRCAWFDQNNYFEFNPWEQNFSVKFRNKLYFRKI